MEQLLADLTGELRGAIGYAAGALLGAFAYSAIFLLLSCVTRHAVAAGLLYVLIWEGLLGGLLSGVRWLSVGAWSTSLADSIVTDDILTKPVSPAYAIIATVVVTVGAVWLAGDRLRSFRLTGEE